MAQYMDKIRDMICGELEKVASKGKLANMADVQLADLLTHSLKSIDTVMAMEEAEYGDSYDGGSYRGRNRDSMGRYSRDGGSSYRRGYSGGGYSGNYSGNGGSYRSGGRNSYSDGKDGMISQLHQMMEEAPNDQEREKVRRLIEQMQDM